jgi:hypothetical protein
MDPVELAQPPEMHSANVMISLPASVRWLDQAVALTQGMPPTRTVDLRRRIVGCCHDLLFLTGQSIEVRFPPPESPSHAEAQEQAARAFQSWVAETHRKLEAIWPHVEVLARGAE